MDKSNKFKIMIVDDEKINVEFLTFSLKDKYQLESCTKGNECLEIIKDFKADIFLLDVMMPEMNGFELCRKIKDNPEFENSVVIFFSALETTEGKLEGYSSGADDYVTKSIPMAELTAKIDKHCSRIESNKKSTEMAMTIAETAMKNGGEISHINKFLESLNSCQDYGCLLSKSMSAFDSFGLNAVLQLRNGGISTDYINGSSPNHLEIELLSHNHGSEKIISLGKRCIFNFKNSSLLVRAMPRDEETAGRYRDHLASIMNGVEAKMHSLALELDLKEKKENALISVSSELQATIQQLMSRFTEYDTRTRNVVEAMESELHLAFSVLDLTEEQEQYFMGIVEGGISQLSDMFGEGLEIDKQFNGIVNHLCQIASQSEVGTAMS